MLGRRPLFTSDAIRRTAVTQHVRHTARYSIWRSEAGNRRALCHLNDRPSLHGRRSYATARHPDLQGVSISIEDSISVIRLNRPSNANSLNQRTMSELLQALQWAEKEPEIRIVILTGEGKFFTAGLDLVDAPKEGPIINDDTIETLSEIHTALIKAEKVLVAAVNGPAIGWGTSSIALFDFVYSVPDAVFQMPFVKLGVCAEACSSVNYMRLLGRQKASSLLLAGDRTSAEEMERGGLITKILPKKGFFDHVLKIAKKIASQPSDALRTTKQLMLEPIRDDLLAANERECARLRERVRTDEPRAAIAAFEREQKAKKAAKA